LFFYYISKEDIQMKKMAIIILLFCIFIGANVKGYSTTGHPEFIEIDFVDEGKLLINFSKEELEYGYQKISKPKFWGWSTYFFNYNCDAHYIGEVLFSKSNKTATPYFVDYVLETSDISKTSTTVSGAISAKIAGAIKKVTGNISGGINGEKEQESKISKTETTKVKIEIPPYSRVALKVTGEAKVTNAVSKYYILGMTFKKGTWETIEAITEYYELYEEKYR